MTVISRRDALAGLATSGAVSLMSAFGEQTPRPAGSDAAPVDPPPLSTADRDQNAQALLQYFAANAPQLLRAPDGILKYPSIAPSLPGKQYSAQLWDWDTLWTSRGLFRRCGAHA